MTEKPLTPAQRIAQLAFKVDQTQQQLSRQVIQDLADKKSTKDANALYEELAAQESWCAEQREGGAGAPCIAFPRVVKAVKTLSASMRDEAELNEAELLTLDYLCMVARLPLKAMTRA